MGRNDGTPFEPAEDLVLLRGVQRHGTSWKRVTQVFSTEMGKVRSLSSLRNRYTRLQRERRKETSKGNRCKRCGERKAGHICSAKMSKRTRMELQDILHTETATDTDSVDLISQISEGDESSEVDDLEARGDVEEIVEDVALENDCAPPDDVPHDDVPHDDAPHDDVPHDDALHGWSIEHIDALFHLEKNTEYPSAKSAALAAHAALVRMIAETFAFDRP